MNNFATEPARLDELLGDYTEGRMPTLDEVLAFQRADHPFADHVLNRWQRHEEDQGQHGVPTAASGGAPPTAAAAQAPSPRQQATGATLLRTPRPVQEPCPTLPDLRLAQIAFFDNGPQTASKDPRSGKRKNAKPQFMTAIDAYTDDPQAPDFDLEGPNWSRNVLMFRHREIPKKLRDWTTPATDGSTSINLPFHDRLAELHELTDSTSLRDRTMFGLFMHTNNGRGFHDQQFIMVDFEHGDVNSGMLFLDMGDPIHLKFAKLTSAGTPLGKNVRGQARFDPEKDYFSSSWATCWL